MKLKLLFLALSVSTAGPLFGQQTIGFLAGLPDQTSSPVFSQPIGTAFTDFTITLATGPSLVDAAGLKSLSGIDLFNAFTALTTGGSPSIVGFRTATANWDTNVAMGGVSETFSSASQLWVIASTAPINSLTTGDYIALIGDVAWQAVDPGAPVKPAVIMNTSKITEAGVPSDVLFVGAYDTTIDLVAVPEPAHFAALFGVFALGFVVYRRRR